MIFWVSPWISCPSASGIEGRIIDWRQDVYYSICCMPTSAFVGHTTMVPRDFAEVKRELEETARKLKGTNDPKARQALLKEMSLLLKEADLITASAKPLTS